MTSLTGCARPVKIDKFFTALLVQNESRGSYNFSGLFLPCFTLQFRYYSLLIIVHQCFLVL